MHRTCQRVYRVSSTPRLCTSYGMPLTATGYPSPATRWRSTAAPSPCLLTTSDHNTHRQASSQRPCTPSAHVLSTPLVRARGASWCHLVRTRTCPAGRPRLWSIAQLTLGSVLGSSRRLTTVAIAFSVRAPCSNPRTAARPSNTSECCTSRLGGCGAAQTTRCSWATSRTW